ncbi:MAG: hypothetical protein HY403_10170 [Elusimicrobia bacterium]|nr:hypothetical protein [Elusimicrobiota bacterium]
MRELTIAALVAAAVAGSVPDVRAAGSHMDRSGKAETISGELLDMSCYMMHEGKGRKHAKCAGACVRGGAPLGLLTKDGKVLLVVGNHEDPKPFLEAKVLAGAEARITGTVFTRGGLAAIVVSTAEKL